MPQQQRRALLLAVLPVYVCTYVYLAMAVAVVHGGSLNRQRSGRSPRRGMVTAVLLHYSTLHVHARTTPSREDQAVADSVPFLDRRSQLVALTETRRQQVLHRPT